MKHQVWFHFFRILHLLLGCTGSATSALPKCVITVRFIQNGRKVATRTGHEPRGLKQTRERQSSDWRISRHHSGEWRSRGSLGDSVYFAAGGGVTSAAIF